MASIGKDKGGRKRVLFVAPDGKRKTIRLGKVSMKAAAAVKVRVEQLVAFRITGHGPDADTANWVANLDITLARKLASVGLITVPETPDKPTLSQHLSNFFASRSDVKQSTLTNWGHTRRNLLTFFGDGRPLDEVTKGDAKDWERWLRTGESRKNRYVDKPADSGLAPNTVRKRVSNAKLFFQDAVDRQLLESNPFAGLKGSVGANRERDYFLTTTDTNKLLENCPDNDWRLIVALSRYGGLRCPSEHLALTWECVDWNRERLRVPSPKTEHHEGKAERWIPIFPELRLYLDAAWDDAKPGAIHIITRYRDPRQNLRSQFKRIIQETGLKPWPKLFQNMRASRATELAQRYPAHVAAAWLGHSMVVASKHYLQVTDEDFSRATCGGSGTESGTPVAQNPAQQQSAVVCEDKQTSPEMVGVEEVTRVNATSNMLPLNGQVGDIGLEPTTSTM